MNILQKGLRKLEEQRRLKIFGNSYLRKKGWQQSFREHAPVSSSSRPIPWMTYPCIMMLNRVLQPHFKVLEYGCGNSSLWFAGLVDSITCVEHDEDWADKIAHRAPSNISIVRKPKGALSPRSLLTEDFFAEYVQLSDAEAPDAVEHGFDCANFIAYAAEIERFGLEYFDVVIVDGMARSLCAHLAAKYVKSGGFIVFDNAERWQYNPGFLSLTKAGFVRIDFYGPGPLATWESCTSIFCRDVNWLKVRPMVEKVFDPRL